MAVVAVLGQLDPSAFELVTASEQHPYLVPAHPPIKRGVVVGSVAFVGAAVVVVGAAVVVANVVVAAKVVVLAAGAQLDPVASDPVTPSAQHPYLVPAHPPIKGGVVVGSVPLEQGMGTNVALSEAQADPSIPSASVPLMAVTVPLTVTL